MDLQSQLNIQIDRSSNLILSTAALEDECRQVTARLEEMIDQFKSIQR